MWTGRFAEIYLSWNKSNDLEQGRNSTLDAATRNLREAVALHLEGEELAALGLAENPTPRGDDGGRAGLRDKDTWLNSTKTANSEA